jgi:hypothetical protein
MPPTVSMIVRISLDTAWLALLSASIADEKPMTLAAMSVANIPTAALPSVERAEPNQTKSISRPRQIRNHLLTPWQYIDFNNTGAANV